MPQSRGIVHWNDGVACIYSPRNLRSLGKNEEFLESVIAQHPGLLGLESRRTGIYGPFVCYRQVALRTPALREVYPDIVILAASGHFIVVEVKLGDNSELKDRDVIAQIIDYASSFAALDDAELVDLFEKSAGSTSSWFDFISSRFPYDENVEELARVIRERVAAGEINLVIACDQLPPGLPEIVRGIATQQSTSFALDLVEVTPYCNGDRQQEILFVPNNRLSTEIVARTTVTVTYQDTAPDVSVETTPIDEVEQTIKVVRSTPTTARVWPPEEVETVVREGNIRVEIELLNFCKKYSTGGEFVSPAVKSNAAFGFFIVGRRSDGRKAKSMLFWLAHGYDALYMNLATGRQLVDIATAARLEDRLTECFGDQVGVRAPNPAVKLSLLDTRMEKFQEIVRWFQGEVVACDQIRAELSVREKGI